MKPSRGLLENCSKPPAKNQSTNEDQPDYVGITVRLDGDGSGEFGKIHGFNHESGL